MSFFFGGHFELAQGLFGFQRFFRAEQERLLFFELGGAGFFQVFFEPLQSFFYLREVRDHEIELDIFNIA